MTPQDYQAQGYQVFPCDGKRPRGTTWPNDLPFRPGDNIGMVVPIGVIALDLDRKPGRDGVAYLKSIAPDDWHHTGPRARTGGGGFHLLFSYPVFLELGNGRGDLPRDCGIDIRAGGKGYLIVAPSVHPETRCPYEWMTPLVTPDKLPPLPEWILTRLLAAPPKPQAVVMPTDRDLGPYLEAALTGEQSRITSAPDGDGNATINLAGFALGQLAHLGLRYSVGLAMLDDATGTWSWRDARDQHAARRTFRSGWEAGERVPRTPEDKGNGTLQRGRSVTTDTRPHGGADQRESGGGSLPAKATERTADGAGDHSRTGRNQRATDPHCQPGGMGAGSTAQRPQILITTQERRVNNQAVQALADAHYPDLYQRNAQLVRVIHAAERNKQDKALIAMADDLPMVRTMSNATLRERLADAADWCKPSDEEPRPAHPPQWSVLAVADRGDYPGIPILRGVASYPMIRADGTVAHQTGYDPGTGYYLGNIPDGLKTNGIATQADAKAAAQRIMDITSDFPFRSDVDRAAWLSYLLTPLARAVITGPTPLFMIDANVRGSGKTLLADVVGLILTGRPLPAHTYSPHAEELEKVLVSVARYGLPLILFDNVVGYFGGSVLDKWLTSTSPTGRILGASEVLQFDWQTVVGATGNNAQIAGDTDRRTIYSTMQSDDERPELRTDFKIEDLPGHIQEHRAELLSDALLILRSHWSAGLPTMRGRAKGTFESWCKRARDAVMFAGLPDCERAPDDEARPMDEDTDELAALLAGLWECFGGASVSVSEIIEAAFPTGHDAYNNAVPLRDVLSQISDKGDKPTRQLVGKRLARYRNRWINDRSLISDRNARTKTHHWRVSERDFAGSPGSVRVVEPLIRVENENLFTKEGLPETPLTPPLPATSKTPDNDDNDDGGFEI